jgi:hypothetical protein
LYLLTGETWLTIKGHGNKSECSFTILGGRVALKGSVRRRKAMPQAADADEAAEKRLCDACVEDSYLRDEIKGQNEISECSYCGKQRPTISIGDLAEKCHRVFETYYERTPSEPEGIDAIAHNDPEGGQLGAARRPTAGSDQ